MKTAEYTEPTTVPGVGSQNSRLVSDIEMDPKSQEVQESRNLILGKDPVGEESCGNSIHIAVPQREV